MLIASLFAPWAQVIATGETFAPGGRTIDYSFRQGISGFTLAMFIPMLVVAAAPVLLVFRSLTTGRRMPGASGLGLAIAAGLLIVWGVVEVNSQVGTQRPSTTSIRRYEAHALGPLVAGAGVVLLGIGWVKRERPAGAVPAKGMGRA